MSVKQISVFVENKKGGLYEVTSVLNKANVDIRALSIADTTDYGILRLIVSNCEKALEALKAEGIIASVTDVLGIEVSDTPGGFSEAVKILFSFIAARMAVTTSSATPLAFRISLRVIVSIPFYAFYVVASRFGIGVLHRPR